MSDESFPSGGPAQNVVNRRPGPGPGLLPTPAASASNPSSASAVGIGRVDGEDVLKAAPSGAAFDARAFSPGFQVLATEGGEIVTTEDGNPIQIVAGPVPFSLDVPGAGLDEGAFTTVMSAGTGHFSVSGSDAEMTITPTRRTQAALPTVESVVARISENPSVFASLASDAARRIQASIDQLEAAKPNEPDALDGYASINAVLTELKTGFDAIANDLDEASTSTVPTVKLSRIESAARAAMQIYDGFIGYYVENGGRTGHVLGKLFLAGTISGALTYFVGVPPAISFAVTAAAIEGENIWDAIKAFATTGKD
jgi:hypothetical protein